MSVTSDKQLVETLVDAVSLAISNDRLSDAATVLQALRVLRPTKRELDTFEAWIAIRRKDWQHALRVLNDMDAGLPQWEFAQTLLAFCQYAIGDPAWTQRAHQLVSNSQSRDTVQLMQLILNPEAAMAPQCSTSTPDPAALSSALLQRI